MSNTKYQNTEVLTLERVQLTYEEIKPLIVNTPLMSTSIFRKQNQGTFFLKLENMQQTGSFKDRGAAAKLLHLSQEERSRGVITASAGNHAQGVAFHASRLNIQAQVVMPVSTPFLKIQRTKQWGAHVILFGDNYDEAYAEAKRLALLEQRTYVHAYNDYDIMAGQGTIALEILEQCPNITHLVAPIGGGGLISGMAVALKSLKPHIKIIGVEAAAVPSMKKAIEMGHSVLLPPQRTLAEGIAVRDVGELCIPFCKKYVDEIILVSEDAIAQAILSLLEQNKTIAEGAGAAATAAILEKQIPFKDDDVVVVLVCGGNLDMTTLGRIIDRGLVKSGRRSRFRLHVPDRPGALAILLTDIAQTGANVIEILHERAFSDISMDKVIVDITLELRNTQHGEEVYTILAHKYLVDILHTSVKS